MNQNENNKIFTSGFDKPSTLMDIEEQASPKRITVEELQNRPGFENTSDEEAENIIETLYQLSIIAYLFYVELEREQKNH